MIYTKTGDAGTTSLIGGVRVNKDDLRLEAYGTIDELNSHIGLLIAMINDAKHENSLKYIPQLQWIQNTLFTVGSFLATDQSKTQLGTNCTITDKMVERIEKNIDEIESSLPPINKFILPGGTMTASQSNICRTVCRRAERRIISLKKERKDDLMNCTYLLKLINRLSDYFFVLARKLNNIEGKGENFWDNACI